eukprot:COSAG02_NODE_18_length_54986_cov_345.599322_23_plen_1085_part_00
MPALNLFGVAWGWSSDDFCCPGVTLLVLRAGWMTALAVAWDTLGALGDCSDGHPRPVNIVPWVDSGAQCPVDLLLSYSRAMLLLQAAEALIEGAAAATSLRGSVMDPRNRRWCIAPLGYVHAVLSVLEALGAALGVQLSSVSDVDADGFDVELMQRCACDNETTRALSFEQDQGLVHEQWVGAATDAIEYAGQLVQVVAVTLCVLCCLVLCSVCCTHHKLNRDRGMGGRSADANLNNRLYRMFSTQMKCCLDELYFPAHSGVDAENPINVLAKILSSFFRGISRNDFVPTDILAAVVLVAQSQKFHVLHPAVEAAKEREREAVQAAGKNENHLTLGVVSKLGIKGAQARAAVRIAHGCSPKSPLSNMAFAAFEGVRPEWQHADPLPLGVEERAQVVSRAEHFMKFALGSYGWMLYAYRKGGKCFSCAPCAIGELCTCCCCRQGRFYGPKHDRGVPGHKDDNCCLTNHSALLRTVWEFGRGGGQNARGPTTKDVPPPRTECRVVYASWTNTLLLKPYAIAIDRRTKNVVLSVRGTLSMNDCMTDILAGEIDLATVSSSTRTPRGGITRGPVSLPPQMREEEEEEDDEDEETEGADADGGDDDIFLQHAIGTQSDAGEYIVPPEDGECVHFAHEGIFRAAAAIEQDLARHGLLEQLLIQGEVSHNELFEVDEDWQDCRGYGLVLTGHSLGAGTATLLAMLLRPSYGERVHCWAYSPPGGLLSEKTVKLTYPYVTSVVVGHDIIPRLGVRTMEQLRDHSLELLMHSNANKTSIICGALCSCLRKKKSEKSARTQEKQLKLIRSTDQAATAREDATRQRAETDDMEGGAATAALHTVRIQDGESQLPSPARDPGPGLESGPEAPLQRSRSVHLNSTGGAEMGTNADAWLKKREHALRRETGAKKVVHARRMYLPGRVLHLTENKKYGMFQSYDARMPTDGVGNGLCNSSKARKWTAQGYSPWWIRDIDTFQEILVSGSMFADHMPDGVMAALQSVEIDSGMEPGYRHTVPEVIEWSTGDRTDSGCDEHPVSVNRPLKEMRQVRAALAAESSSRGSTQQDSGGDQRRQNLKGELTITLPHEDANVSARP